MRRTLIVAASVFALAGCGGSGGGGGGSSSNGSTAPIQTSTGSTPGGTTPGGSSAPSTVTPAPLPSGAVGGARVEGVDVSEHDGTIDWTKVSAAGIKFAFIRVSDGTQHPDSTFATNWAGAKSHDIIRGAYQYFRAAQSGVAQADLLLNKMGAIGAGDLPPVCDVETLDGVSAATLKTQLTAWVNEIQAKTGLTPIIYCASGFWDPLGIDFSDEDLWVANWQVSSPSIPAGWKGWFFWQYTDSGTVSGISTAVDRDRYQGSLADLKAYTGLAPASGFFRGLAVDSTGKGGWLVSNDGGVFEHGDATFRGTAGGSSYAQPFLGITRSPSGLGYRLVAADGTVKVFGDALHAGDLAGKSLAAPIVGLAGTATNKGYWLLARDGDVSAFGDAQPYGRVTTTTTVAVGIAATPAGDGYFVALADGTVEAFGAAISQGDLTGKVLSAPIVGLAATPTGKGYWLAASDGSVYAFGDAPALSYKGTAKLNGQVTGITATLSGQGFWLVADDGTTFENGDAVALGYRTR